LSGFTFHLPPSALSEGGAKMKPFYQSLTRGLKDAGHSVSLVNHDRDAALAQIEADDGFHIFDHGQLRHARALNAGIAYVYPFWNLDPWGIRAFSSIAAQKFDPQAVPAQAAAEFFGRLRHRLVKKRASRYPQPPEVAQDLPRECIAIFLQSEFHRDVGETCYLTRAEMVQTVLEAAPDKPVVIKPHPRDLEPETYLRLHKLLSEWPNLTISSANIHDILGAADKVVTINSAVGIEAQLHRVSVILCGHADFFHVCHTAKTTTELTALVQQDLAPQPVEAYLHWYFRQNCLAAGDPELVTHFLDRVAQTGFAL